MIVGGVKYTPGPVWGPLEIPDSFVVRANKVGAGAGEAKLYVGPRNDSALRDHFGSELFSADCVMFRDELVEFMDAIRTEYDNPSQEYVHKSDLRRLWKERRAKVAALPAEAHFHVKEQRAGADRCYLKGPGSFELLRELPLPRCATVTFTKCLSVDGIVLHVVRLHVKIDSPASFDREDDELRIIRGIEEDSSLDELTRLQIIKARVGQGRYRSDLLDSCGAVCPMTGINDPALLVASHIKPWRDSSNAERLDPQNGFVLSPLWDRLFDEGLISFDDSGQLLVSSKVDSRTRRLVGLVPGAVFSKLPVAGVSNSGRRTYLAHHRARVFLG